MGGRALESEVQRDRVREAVAVCVHDPYRACSRQRCEVRDETDRLALLSILGTGHKHGDRTYMASVTALAWGTPDGCTPTPSPALMLILLRRESVVLLSRFRAAPCACIWVLLMRGPSPLSGDTALA